jgi:hypothetical protein
MSFKEIHIFLNSKNKHYNARSITIKYSKSKDPLELTVKSLLQSKICRKLYLKNALILV